PAVAGTSVAASPTGARARSERTGAGNRSSASDPSTVYRCRNDDGVRTGAGGAHQLPDARVGEPGAPGGDAQRAAAGLLIGSEPTGGPGGGQELLRGSRRVDPAKH